MSSGATVIRRCPVCRKMFEIAESRLKHGRGLHCSRACQYIANCSKLSKPVACICVGCGQMFMRSPSQLRNTKGAGKYCTRACRDEHWRGQLNPNWVNGEKVNSRGPNWQAIRRAIIARDGVCQKCGASGALHVHHMIPFRLFDSHKDANDSDNLVSLCPPCHRIEDAISKWAKLPDSAGVLRLSAGGAAHQLAKERGLL